MFSGWNVCILSSFAETGTLKLSRNYFQAEKMWESFILSLEKFCQVEFYSKPLTHEISPWS